MDAEVKQAVLEFLSEHSSAPLPDDEEQALGVAFLDEGLLDSLAVVELITTLEDRWGFRLDADEMTSPEFRTVGGFIAVMSRARAAA